MESGRVGLSLPLGYFLAPWMLGHLTLYLCARATSAARQRLRLALLPDWKAQLLGEGGGGQSTAAKQAKLRSTFDRFDTSGDGYLDAAELKLALRFVTGEDVSVEDCERIVRSMDTDGDGVIDFHEVRLSPRPCALSFSLWQTLPLTLTSLHLPLCVACSSRPRLPSFD